MQAFPFERPGPNTNIVLGGRGGAVPAFFRDGRFFCRHRYPKKLEKKIKSYFHRLSQTYKSYRREHRGSEGMVGPSYVCFADIHRNEHPISDSTHNNPTTVFLAQPGGGHKWRRQHSETASEWAKNSLLEWPAAPVHKGKANKLCSMTLVRAQELSQPAPY